MDFDMDFDMDCPNIFGDDFAPILYERDKQPVSSKYEPEVPIPFDLSEFNTLDADIIFKDLAYDIYWVDMNYPHSQYSGYQEMLQKKFPKTPFKVLADSNEAVYKLNTTKANTRLVVILSGRKKKNLLQRVHDSVGIEKIFVLKQFCKLSLESWPKIFICPTYEVLIEEILKVINPVDCKVTGTLIKSKEELIDLTVEADPMVMSDKCVRAIRYEISLKEEMIRSKYKYSVTVGIMLKYFTEMLEEYNKSKKETDIKVPLYSGLFSNNKLTKAKSLELMIILLKLAIEFDSCNFILDPLSITAVSKTIKGNIDPSVTILNQSANEVLKSLSLGIYHTKDFEDLHEQLLCYFSKANKGQEWRNLHIAHMLLSDLDLCFKLFIDLMLREDKSFKSFVEPFINAGMVSDARVSTIREIWKRSEFKEDTNYTKQFTKSEMAIASQSCAIQRIIFFNTSPIMNRLLKSLTGIIQYSFIHDFEVEESTLRTLKHKTALFIIEHAIKRAEYLQLIDICVRLSITPVIIVYIKKGIKEIAKECFRISNVVIVIYCQSVEELMNYLNNKELNLVHQMQYCKEYYGDFKETLSSIKGKSNKVNIEERDDGWELLDKIDSQVFAELVEEKVLASKLIGSLNFYIYNQFKTINKPLIYWENYAPLFGATERATKTLEVEFARKLLKAYTLQTDPGFYKLMNDAFRSSNPDKIGMYRVFYTSLLNMVKNKLLEKYNGTIYRGTYFNASLLASLKPGLKLYSSCFTSTSKSAHVAQEFARKTKRNVMLEIELDKDEYSNVDIHSENCSLYPEEYEVLLLPFARFEIARIFEGEVTIVALKQLPSEVSIDNYSAIDYYS